MLLFGIYFPEPFTRAMAQAERGVDVGFAPALAFDTLTSLYINLAGYHDYQQLPGWTS